MSLTKLVSMMFGLVFVLGVIWVIYFISNGVDSSPTINNASSPAKASEEMDGKALTASPLIIGDLDAPVTLIEYADYKCPECGKFHSDVGKQIRQEYVDTGKVKIIFRPYPVYSVDGAKALLGSYCAQLQGKFTQYHDRMFEYMWANHFKNGDYQKAIDPVLTEPVMSQLLGELAIDSNEYYSCLDDEATNQIYLDDIYLAAPDDIQGTPSFIIGGQKIVGPQPFSVFKTLLDIQLQ